MLNYIKIKNFAIIKDVELDLQPEMSSLTGETGAGKSIIVDSLELALGNRADTSLIRNNADRCEITIAFDLTNITNKAREWLTQQDLSSGNECIIRRIISNDGRSKSSINGNPCTQQTLRTVSSFLLSIHGQHEHQNLLDHEYQRKLLDAFASTKQLAAKVEELYNAWSKNRKKLAELENLIEDHESKIDFLSHQLQELDNIDFSTKNIERLRTEQKRLNSIEQFSNSINSALKLISENDGKTVISDLYSIKSQLEICKNIDAKVTPVIDLINSAIIQIEEASSSLRQNLHDSEHDTDLQKQIEEQLTYIYTIARKHHTQPEQLPQIRLDIKQQLETIQNAAAHIEKTKSEIKKAEIAYLIAANELSNKRKSAASKLNHLVSTKMQLLGMPEGKFVVNLLPNINSSFAANGQENIEFLVSANPGYSPQSLTKIASGGELSRISLAIQVITAEKEVTPTLIFDEIDAGIGSKTAEIVGKLLRELAKKTQVICITHLPQIAVQSQHHLLIKKIITMKTTEVTVSNLNKNERIQEIARMLGGAKITKQTVAHAEEMLHSLI